MQFREFYNKNKNVIEASTSRRITSSLPISEERDKFFNGELFKKYDMVESDGVQYRILEQCSNYYQCVDNSGNLSKKFAKQLTIGKPSEVCTTESLFHGYTVQTESARSLLRDHMAIIDENFDDVGLLKTLKEADKKMDTGYQNKDRLTIAKMIADACGVPHDVVSTPENLVAQSIRKAKKDPVMMRNKEVISNMLEIAKSVGIKFSDSTFEPKVNEAYDDHERRRQNLVGTRVNGDHVVHHFIHPHLSYKERSDTVVTKNHKTGEVNVHHIGADRKDSEWHNSHTHDKDRPTKRFSTTAEAAASIKKNNPYAVHHKAVNESEQLDELSIGTMRDYSVRAKDSAVKLSTQGTKAKSLKVSYKKFAKAGDRLSNAAKADKKVFKKEWEKTVGIKESITLSQLRTKLSEATKVEDTTPDVVAPSGALPHGHTMGPTSDTHRKQLIKKLKND
jgi:hypothetical protein